MKQTEPTAVIVFCIRFPSLTPALGFYPCFSPAVHAQVVISGNVIASSGLAKTVTCVATIYCCWAASHFPSLLPCDKQETLLWWLQARHSIMRSFRCWGIVPSKLSDIWALWESVISSLLCIQLPWSTTSLKLMPGSREVQLWPPRQQGKIILENQNVTERTNK